MELQASWEHADPIFIVVCAARIAIRPTSRHLATQGEGRGASRSASARTLSPRGLRSPASFGGVSKIKAF